MDREELLREEGSAWAALTAVLDRVPAERRAEEGVVPGWSAHDLIWHCGYWAGYVAGQLDGTGDPDDHDDEYWDALNAQLVEEARAMSWEESLTRSERERERARSALLAVTAPSPDQLREFEDETFVHYREHTAEIEAFLGG
jgi:hypothetical protein